MEVKFVPPDKLNEFAKILGSKGGQETLKRYGSEYFKKIRKLSKGNTKK